MRKIALFFISMISLVALSRPTDGYYNDVDGQSGQSLFYAIKAVSGIGYMSHSYNDLWEFYWTTDCREDGTVWDMYSDCTFAFTKKCGTYNTECQCYNREHSVPKSWFGGSTSNAPGNDIFHVVPTDGEVNNKRGNYPFGEVIQINYQYDGAKLGASGMEEYAGIVFEPQDQYKGDFARGYLYMIVRYGGEFNFTTGNGSAIFNTNYTAAGHYGLTTYGVALLLKWHRQDPVSQKELDRNDAAQAVQGNRNPFIDYPELAEYLWGNKKEQTVQISKLTCAYGGTSTGGDDPDPDPDPVENEYTSIVECIEIGEELGVGGTSGDFYTVKGVVTDIQEISTSYGNATFTISDKEENSLLCFHLKDIGNENFTDNEKFALNDTLIVYGQIKNFNGTIEISNGYLVDIIHPKHGELSAVQTIDYDAINIYVLDGNLIIENAEEVTKKLFSLTGQLLYNGKHNKIALPHHGGYILNVENKVYKVIY